MKKKYIKLEKIVCKSQMIETHKDDCRLCRPDESNKLCPSYQPITYIKYVLDNQIKPYQRKEQ